MVIDLGARECLVLQNDVPVMGLVKVATGVSQMNLQSMDNAGNVTEDGKQDVDE